MCYFRGLKHLIRVMDLDRTPHQDKEVAVLVDWVYYHDILARFSLRHYRLSTRGPLKAADMKCELNLPVMARVDVSHSPSNLIR